MAPSLFNDAPSALQCLDCPHLLAEEIAGFHLGMHSLSFRQKICKAKTASDNDNTITDNNLVRNICV
jgi:hypothetical protein|tara:strand:+ start:2865 stop:3065 length:201 start_codon:yes stop_codon:yes gene_type:complete